MISKGLFCGLPVIGEDEAEDNHDVDDDDDEDDYDVDDEEEIDRRGNGCPVFSDTPE